MMLAEARTFTIIQADGLYLDDTIEQEILKPRESESYVLDYSQTDLSPPGMADQKPWSEVDGHLRERVDGIMTLKTSFTGEDLALFPRLKVIVRMGVGYDTLDRKALAARGVTVCNIPDYGTEEIADHALALTLSLRRGIVQHHERQRQTPPAPWLYVDTPLVRRLRSSVFGILGFGRIGMAAAVRAKAFGFHVLFYDPYVANGVEKALGVERTRDIRDFFSRSVSVSIHCPSTSETRGMVDYELLRLLPRGAVVVNTARGDVVDLKALEKAMDEGIVSGAGLDVLPLEPIPDDQVPSLIQAYRRKEEWLDGRLIITPHTAFYSPEAYDEIRIKSAECMRRLSSRACVA